MVVSIEAARAERRREPRQVVDRVSGTAMVLGDDDSRTPCRVVDTSRTGMRIVVKQPFPQGAQVHVEWDGKFFVGTTCYRFVKADSYVVGLELVTCNYGTLPGKTSFALSRLGTFLRLEVSRLMGGRRA